MVCRARGRLTVRGPRQSARERTMTSYTIQPSSTGEYLVSTWDGYYTHTGDFFTNPVWHDQAHDLGSVGAELVLPVEFFNLQVNDYLNFNLSSVEGAIRSMTLVISNYNIVSPDSSERIFAYDVSTPTNQLLAGLPNGSTDKSIYNDLGSGTLYGSGTAVPAGPDPQGVPPGIPINISLNADAIAAALANPSNFNIGLTLPDQNHLGERFLDSGGARQPHPPRHYH